MVSFTDVFSLTGGAEELAKIRALIRGNSRTEYYFSVLLFQ